jgi:flagellar basal body-associated protein FliL
MAEIHVQTKKNKGAPSWIWIALVVVILAVVVYYFVTRNGRAAAGNGGTQTTTYVVEPLNAYRPAASSMHLA